MIDFSKYDDIELSYLLKSEDKKIAKAAFDVIYSRYSARIYTFCYRFIRNKEIAQDIFQEVFIKFYKIINSKNQIENIGGYLQKTARNLCLNSVTSRQKVNLQIEESNMIIIDNEFELKQDREIIDKAISMLPYNLREIIILREFLNYSYDEIAEMMELKRNSVGVLLHRAKQRLKEILEPYFSEMVVKESEHYEY
jgi:RNA polymerase sigma-70 factor (ECF subfamily)